MLAQLGARTSLISCVADDDHTAFCLGALRSFGVDVSLCPVVAGRSLPTSYILCSRETQSRTIMHHRDMPELGTVTQRRWQ